MIHSGNSRIVRNLTIALMSLVVIFMMGTVGYRLLSGSQASWVDCFYMTFITIASIGFTEVVDVTQYEYGRLFTVFIGISGIGLLGYSLSTFMTFMLESDLNDSWRRRNMQKKIDQLKGHYLVCGAGLVGNNVAHELAMNGRKTVIIDANIDNIHRFLQGHPEHLFMNSDATDNDTLLAAGILRAKGVFAVARDDNTNLVISLSAKQLNPDLRVVARCHDLKNADKIRLAGADEVISPDYSGGLSLVSAMVRPNVMSFLDEIFKAGSNVRMEEILVSEKLTGKPLNTLYQDNDSLMVLAVKNQHSWQFNPPSDQILASNQVLMVMTTSESRSLLEHRMNNDT